MSEEFWWKKAGIFFSSAGKSKFVKDVHLAFLRRVDELGLPLGEKALDAGCGDGNISFPLAKRGFDVTGIDFGDSVLKQAYKKKNRLGIKNINFEFGDLNEKLKYEDNSFSLITSAHVIMKIKKYDTAISEFYRVLKQGGFVVISTTSSNETFTHWLIRYMKKNGIFRSLWDIRWLIAWGIPYCLLTSRKERRDEWRWPVEELTAHFKRAGFSVVHTEEVPYTHVGASLGIFKK